MLTIKTYSPSDAPLNESMVIITGDLLTEIMKTHAKHCKLRDTGGIGEVPLSLVCKYECEDVQRNSRIHLWQLLRLTLQTTPRAFDLFTELSQAHIDHTCTYTCTDYRYYLVIFNRRAPDRQGTFTD